MLFWIFIASIWIAFSLGFFAGAFWHWCATAAMRERLQAHMRAAEIAG